MSAVVVLRRLMARASSPRQTSKILGHVDEIAINRVRGWVAVGAKLNTPLPFKMYLDGDLVSIGVASAYREDVEKAGFGDGRHGFDRSVPERQLANARTLRIDVEVDGEYIEFITRSLSEARPPARAHRQHVFLDITDLVEFYRHYREVSGIQRVQRGYVIGLLSLPEPDFAFNVCLRLNGRLGFTVIPNDKALRLLKDADDVRAVPTSEWRRHVERLLSELSQKIDFESGDILLTLGAPWASDRHNEAVLCARRKADILYFQVFYDLIPIRMPEVVAEGLVSVFAQSMSGLFAHADHVFSISDYSAKDIEKVAQQIGWRCPPASLVDMGGNIDDRDKIKAGIPLDVPNKVGKFDLSQRFVLCVGTLEPRKNHILLYRVWRLLVEKYGTEATPKLVLVGRVGWHMEEFVRTLRVTNNLGGIIVHLADVSDLELAALYDNCLFTVFPSFYEGWGLPITESFLHGKICVCSNVTSMPEAGGEFAIYIDPHDLREAFRTIDELIFDEGARMRWQKKLETWKAITWPDAAERFAIAISRASHEALKLSTNERRSNAILDLEHLYRFNRIHDGKSALEVLTACLEKEKIAMALDGNNWFLPDDEQTWACGRDAKFVLRFSRELAAPLIAYFEIEFAPGSNGREFKVSVDDVHRGVFSCRDGANNKVAVQLEGSHAPDCALRAHRVVFSLSDNVTPTEVGADNRLFGVGIRSMYVCENRAEARLKYYERDANCVIV